MIPVVCWRCEKPGHVAAECKPPAAKDRKQLQARIDRYVERWIAGEITVQQKTAWIKDELRMREKEKAK